MTKREKAIRDLIHLYLAKLARSLTDQPAGRIRPYDAATTAARVMLNTPGIKVSISKDFCLADVEPAKDGK